MDQEISPGLECHFCYTAGESHWLFMPQYDKKELQALYMLLL